MPSVLELGVMVRGVIAGGLLWCAAVLPVHADGFDIFVVRGQSNADCSGHGPIVDRHYTPQIDKRIRQLGRFGTDFLKVVPVGEVIDGVKHAGLQHWRWRPGQEGHCFILTTARVWAARQLAADRQVLIIPAASPSTSSGCVLATVIDWPECHLMYHDLVGRVRYALTLGDSRLISIHEAQGVRDVGMCRDGLEKPSEFRANKQTYLQWLRRDLPNVPFIATEFVPTWLPNNPCRWRINRIVKRLKDLDPMAATVSSRNLLSNADVLGPGAGSHAHFSGQSQVILGQRHYLAVRDMLGLPKP